MPMNINGIPYNSDYMQQYYRPPLHQVRFLFIKKPVSFTILIIYIINLGRTAS